MIMISFMCGPEDYLQAKGTREAGTKLTPWTSSAKPSLANPLYDRSADG